MLLLKHLFLLMQIKQEYELIYDKTFRILLRDLVFILETEVENVKINFNENVKNVIWYFKTGFAIFENWKVNFSGLKKSFSYFKISDCFIKHFRQSNIFFVFGSICRWVCRSVCLSV